MQRIDSADNKRLKRLASLKKKKVRLEENLFLIEGVKIIKEAMVEKAGIEMVLVSETFLMTNGILCDEIDAGYDLYVTNDRNLSKCSSLKTPPGIIASVRMPEYGIEEAAGSRRPLVILDGIGDPGNMGTIIRTADAFAFGGVILLPDCTDPYSPKTVQSTMGSVFRVKSIPAEASVLDILKDAGYVIYGMDMGGENLADKVFPEGIPAVVIGSESHGIKPEIRKKCDGLLGIGMQGNAESLNASVAAGIAMHKIAGYQVDNRPVD